MQDSSRWAPPGGTLGQILEETRRRVASINTGATANGSARAERVRRVELAPALKRPQVAVIAELKRRSPSKGVLNELLSAADQAATFERAGAAAISILTEPAHFGGSLEDLTEAAGVTALPLLKKDFHVDAAQIREAAASAASAVLLIARALPPATLIAMIAEARTAGLEAVVEIRTERELETALRGGAAIVGVNSRDLETLQVDETVPERLIPKIPADVVAIWESGVRTEADVRRAAECGADAVLVGSALSSAADPELLLRSLTTVSRRGRRG